MTSSGDESDARPLGEGESTALHGWGMDVPGDDGAESCTLRGRVTPSSAGRFAEDHGSWRVTSALEISRVGGIGGNGLRERADGEGAAAIGGGRYPTFSSIGCTCAIRTAQEVWRRSTLQHYAWAGETGRKRRMMSAVRGSPGHGDGIIRSGYDVKP